jgi:hypothetical protein
MNKLGIEAREELFEALARGAQFSRCEHPVAEARDNSGTKSPVNIWLPKPLWSNGY